jgi:ABC-type multidrug transport system ATPase subunit
MAGHLCSRIGIINKGELVAAVPISEVRDQVVPGGSVEEAFLKVTDPDEARSAAP